MTELLLLFALLGQEREATWETNGWIRAGGRALDVFIAEVTSVPDGPHTNTHPPEVALKVIKVIHGDPKVDRTRVTWMPNWPFPFGLCGNDSGIAAWEKKPFTEYPIVGKRYLVSGEPRGTTPPTWGVHGDTKALHTDELLAAVEKWYSRGAEIAKKAAAELADQPRKEAEAAAAFWAAKVAKADLKTLFGRGDFIGVGRCTAGYVSRTAPFVFTEVLRGPLLRDRGATPYSADVQLPTNGERAFLGTAKSFLVVLRAQGFANQPINPFYTLLPDEQGIFPLTDENLAMARAWCAEHPADPAAEKEIIARCKGWATARRAGYAFSYIEGEWNALRTLEEKEQYLAVRFDTMEQTLKLFEAPAQLRAREDEELRTIMGGWWLRRAVIAAQRGLMDDATAHLRKAVATRTVHASRIEAEPALKDVKK